MAGDFLTMFMEDYTCEQLFYSCETIRHVESYKKCKARMVDVGRNWKYFTG